MSSGSSPVLPPLPWSPDLRIDGADDPGARTVVLAHGAGAPMDSPFLETVAHTWAAAGLRVVRFEFPYMAARRRDGKRKPPDREARLIDAWLAVIGHLGDGDLIIGGKSMGGRIASMVADRAGARGLVCLGYPFHPPGRPEKTRVGHLADLRTPTLVCQGERDLMGTRADVDTYCLSPAIRLHWLADGDHGFKPRKASGRCEDDNLHDAIATALRFIEAL